MHHEFNRLVFSSKGPGRCLLWSRDSSRATSISIQIRLLALQVWSWIRRNTRITCELVRLWTPPQPRATELGALGVGPSHLCFTKPSLWLECTHKFETLNYRILSWKAKWTFGFYHLYIVCTLNTCILRSSEIITPSLSTIVCCNICVLVSLWESLQGPCWYSVPFLYCITSGLSDQECGQKWRETSDTRSQRACSFHLGLSGHMSGGDPASMLWG